MACIINECQRDALAFLEGTTLRLEVKGKEWISWLHEREWRCKGSFKLPADIHGVLVKNTERAVELTERIRSERA